MNLWPTFPICSGKACRGHLFRSTCQRFADARRMVNIVSPPPEIAPEVELLRSHALKTKYSRASCRHADMSMTPDIDPCRSRDGVI